MINAIKCHKAENYAFEFMHFFPEKGVDSSPDARREPMSHQRTVPGAGEGGIVPREPQLNGDPLSGGGRMRPLQDFTQRPSSTSPQSSETLRNVSRMLQKM